MKKFTILLLFFSLFPLASLALEASYLPIPDSPAIADRTPLPVYVRYVYLFFISTAGVLAALMLIIGAIQYMASAGSQGKMKEGISKMMAAVAGIIILFSSYLILNTINPEFVYLEAPKIEEIVPGVMIATSRQAVGPYVCIKEVPMMTLWSKSLEAIQLYNAGKDVPKDTLKAIETARKQVNKYCEYIYSSKNLSHEYDGGENDPETIWVYLVPIYQKTEFGLVLYQDRDFKGKGVFVFNTLSIGENTRFHDTPQVFKIPKTKLASAKPFYIIYDHQETWNARFFELVDKNAGEPAAKEESCTIGEIEENLKFKWCDLGYLKKSFAGCDGYETIEDCNESGFCAWGGGNSNNDSDDSENDGDNDEDSGDSNGECKFYSVGFDCADEYGSVPKISSVKIEGDLFVVFKKCSPKFGSLLVPEDLYILSQKENSSLFDDEPIKNWNNVCKEKTAEEPSGIRSPCAEEAMIISGKVY